MTNQQTNWKWNLAQRLEYKWWQRYLRKKEVGRYLENKRRYWSELLDHISPFITLTNNHQILDAGCGPSGIYMVLEGNQVTAIDPLLHQYKNLPHFQPANYSWVNFENHSIESLKSQSQFDIIFCMNAINHVDDIHACYDNLVSALKPGGLLVISTDTHRNDLVKKVFQLIPGDMLHPIQLNQNEYSQMLTNRGIKVLGEMLYKREMIFDYYITVAQK